VQSLRLTLDSYLALVPQFEGSLSLVEITATLAIAVQPSKPPMDD
jgi:hypothetical protein